MVAFYATVLPMSASAMERDGAPLSVIGRIASLWLAWAFLVTVGCAWSLFYHLTPSAHHLDDVRGGDGC